MKTINDIFRRILATFCLLIAISHAGVCEGTTRYVSLAGGHVPPFTSWANAATTIQAAVDACTDGDIVLVTNGIYNTGYRVREHYSSGVVVTSWNRVVVSPNVSVASVNGPDVTIIEGEKGEDFFDYGVRCAWLLAESSLSGFTLRKGSPCRFMPYTRDREGGIRGGGVYSCCYATISNCVVASNTATLGGGVYGASVVDCVIEKNHAQQAGSNNGSVDGYGGGVMSCMVMNSTLRNNTASERGGGAYNAYLWDSELICNASYHEGGGAHGCNLESCMVISNEALGSFCLGVTQISHYNHGEGGGLHGGSARLCIVKHNQANRYGGGAFDTRMENCLVSFNRVFGGCYENFMSVLTEKRGEGGGVYKGTLINCILLDNEARIDGGGAYDARVINSIVYDNTSPADSNAASCSLENSITDDPGFTGPDHTRLLMTSPCINAGDNSWVTWSDDLDGNPRIIDDQVDIGAYEYSTAQATGHLEATISVAHYQGLKGHPMTFEALVDGVAISYMWTWGDGTYDVNTFSPEHTYAAGGSYTIMFYAWNNTHVISIPIYVTVSDSDELYVSPFGGHVYPYDSWNKAATNVAAATELCADDMTVWVTNGYYQLVSSVELDASANLQSVNGPEVTVMDGRDAVRCVRLANSNAVIRGFSVTGGIAHEGAGILTEGGFVEDCIIYANQATNNYESYSGGGGRYFTGDGGGISVQGGVVRNCIIKDNEAGSGGGVYAVSNALVENCLIVSNITHTDWKVSGGGGVNCNGSTIRNCEVRNNVGDVEGGGILCSDTSLVENCIIEDNDAWMVGGGFCSYEGSIVRNCIITDNRTSMGAGGYLYNAVLENCTVISNQSTSTGGGVELYKTNIIRNCIIVMNSNNGDPSVCNVKAVSSPDSVISYSLTQPLQDGVGNLVGDPVFVGGDDNYQLMPSSPCIDAGEKQDWMYDAEDVEGNPRIYGENVDIGACEFYAAELVCDFMAEPPFGIIPHTPVFTAYVAGTNTTGLLYQWDLNGDGTFEWTGADLQTVTGRYDVGGWYDVVLEVQNELGNTSRCERFGYIKAAPETMFVSPVGSHELPYANWATASTSLQAAVDLCVDGCQVWVSNGVYEVISEVEIHDAVTLRSVNGFGATVVTAVQETTCFKINHEQAVVDGFTVTGGSAQNGGGVYIRYGGTLRNSRVTGNKSLSDGGGVFCYYGGIVRDCIFEDNEASGYGGGVCIEYGGSVYDSLFRTNWSHSGGGGIYVENSGTVVGCSFIENTAVYHGGGVRLSGAGGYAEDCIFLGNHAQYGGGAYAYESRFHRCRFEQNTATNGGGVYLRYGGMIEQCVAVSNRAVEGGGMYCYRQSRVSNMLLTQNNAQYGGGVFCDSFSTLQHLTVIDNDADYLGGGLYSDDISYVGTGVLRNSVIYGNRAGTGSDVSLGNDDLTVEYCCASDLPGGVGNIETDPLLSSDDDGAYRLQGDSPCIDACTASCSVSADLDGVPRPLDGNGDGVAISDMGAYEYVHTHYLAKDGSHEWPFATWATASTNIANVVDCAVSGNAVLVSNGVYTLDNCLDISKAITLSGASGPEQSTLQGGWIALNHSNAVLSGLRIADGWGVSLENGLIENCLIENCTSVWGGGLSIYDGVVSNCVIRGNIAEGSDWVEALGGGVYQIGGVLTHSQIESNSAYWGGGIYVSSGTVQACRIAHNVAVSASGIDCMRGCVEDCLIELNHGSAAKVRDPDGVIRRCRITANDGSGVLCYREGLLENCLIYANTGSVGGVVCSGGHVVNVTVVDNVSPDGVGGIWGSNKGKILNSISAFNISLASGTESNYARISNPYGPYSMALYTDDPMFVDHSGGDYRLLPGSLCIDAGYDRISDCHSAEDAPLEDFARRIRPVDGDGDGVAAFDIGAFERMGFSYADASRADDSGDGLTWATAKKTLQAAVNVVDIGGHIWVTNGVYDQGRCKTPGGKGTNRVCMINASTMQSVNGPDVTIIDGRDAVRGVFMTNGCFLAGFTVTNGMAPYRTFGGSPYDMQEYNGGGIWMSENCVVSNCVMKGNTASDDGHGGGASGGILIDCELAGNKSGFIGGGAYKSMLVNCRLYTNFASGHGGGVYLGTMRGCVLYDNGATTGGGAESCDLIDCTLSNNSAPWGGAVYGCNVSNCSIVGNFARSFGGGAYGSTLYDCTVVGNTSSNGGGAGRTKLFNCVVRNNSATDNGAGVYGCEMYHSTIADNFGPGCYDSTQYNCIVWGNTGYDVSGGYTAYSCASDGITHGVNGCITNNPLFVSASTGDYHLRVGSPCIDAANPSNSLSVDLDGVPRPLDGNGDGVAISDMGAYEYMSAAADSDRDGVNDGDECAVYGTNPTQSDSDGDGQSDRDEIVARMDPNDPDSFFAVRQMTAQQRGAYDLVLEWPTSAECTYTLYCCESLTCDWTAVPGWIAMPGTGAAMSYAVPEGAELRGFYRVKSEVNP